MIYPRDGEAALSVQLRRGLRSYMFGFLGGVMFTVAVLTIVALIVKAG